MLGHIVDINANTRLAGDLDSAGVLPLKNLTQNYRFKALVVETRCHRARAIELIGSNPS